jgi:hypothetical protein
VSAVIRRRQYRAAEAGRSKASVRRCG